MEALASLSLVSSKQNKSNLVVNLHHCGNRFLKANTTHARTHTHETRKEKRHCSLRVATFILQKQWDCWRLGSAKMTEAALYFVVKHSCSTNRSLPGPRRANAVTADDDILNNQCCFQSFPIHWRHHGMFISLLFFMLYISHLALQSLHFNDYWTIGTVCFKDYGFMLLFRQFIAKKNKTFFDKCFVYMASIE